MAEAAMTTANPFAATAPQAKQPGALAQTDQQRAIAEVQAALAIARANPRDPVQAMDRVLNACCRPTLAEAALYQFSRGGSDITGPSIRLAEAVAQAWGNIQFGIRELEQRPGESVVQAYAWDVETNTRREMTFTVPHIRHTRKGSYRLEDPRDIYETVANQGARRLRACILSVIPGDVIEAAVKQCELTLNAHADTSPEALEKMVEAFGKFGVTRAQIEKRIQRRLDAITPAHMVTLKKIYASLRDGMSVPADWFEPEQQAQPEAPEPASKTESLKARLAGGGQPEPVADAPDKGVLIAKARAAMNEQALDEVRKEAEAHLTGGDKAAVSRAINARFRELREHAANQEPFPPAEDEPKQGEMAGPTYAEIADMLNKAGNTDQLDEALDLIRHLPEDQQEELRVLGARLRDGMTEPA